DTITDFVKESEQNRTETHEKLNHIIQKLEDHDKTDKDHDAKITETTKSQKELRDTVNRMVASEVRAKGVPIAGGLGIVGYLIGTLIEHIPLIAQAIVTIWKGIS